MKQKTRFKKFGNIGNCSMNSQYIGIGPKKTYRPISNNNSVRDCKELLEISQQNMWVHSLWWSNQI